MDWSAPLEAIRQAIAKAALLPDIAVPSSPRAGAQLRPVEWRNRRGGNRVTKGQYINLMLFGIIGVGRDETRYDYLDENPSDPTQDALRPVQMGNRIVRIQLSCKSDSQEPEKTAGMLAERIRSRIRLPEVKAILAAQDVGYSHIEWSTTDDYIDADERAMSEAMVEIVFLKAVSERASDDASMDYFDRVDGEGTIEDGANGDVTVTFDSADGAPEDP